jgi:hypothetical protein
MIAASTGAMVLRPVSRIRMRLARNPIRALAISVTAAWKVGPDRLMLPA